MSGFATMRAMIALGLSDEQKSALLDAMEADAKPKDRTAAERQARHREKVRVERDDVTRDVTRDTVTADPSPQSPPLKSPPDPQKITPPLTPQPATVDQRAREPFPRPEWADPQVWSDLLANRRKKNLANTPSAHRKLLADIAKLTDRDWPPGRVLEAAVSRGWGAIYAGCKDDDDGRRNGNSNRGSSQPVGGSRPSATFQLRQAAAAAEREDAAGRERSWTALPAAGSG